MNADEGTGGGGKKYFVLGYSADSLEKSCWLFWSPLESALSSQRTCSCPPKKEKKLNKTKTTHLIPIYAAVKCF